MNNKDTLLESTISVFSKIVSEEPASVKICIHPQIGTGEINYFHALGSPIDCSFRSEAFINFPQALAEWRLVERQNNESIIRERTPISFHDYDYPVNRFEGTSFAPDNWRDLFPDINETLHAFYNLVLEKAGPAEALNIIYWDDGTFGINASVDTYTNERVPLDSEGVRTPKTDKIRYHWNRDKIIRIVQTDEDSYKEEYPAEEIHQTHSIPCGPLKDPD